jgi:predicted site-specific integrase-resolvase
VDTDGILQSCRKVLRLQRKMQDIENVAQQRELLAVESDLAFVLSEARRQQAELNRLIEMVLALVQDRAEVLNQQNG